MLSEREIGNLKINASSDEDGEKNCLTHLTMQLFQLGPNDINETWLRMDNDKIKSGVAFDLTNFNDISIILFLLFFFL